MRCPKCKKKIQYLLNVSNWWKRYFMTLDKKGNSKYQLSKEWSGDENTFDCPECGEVLFTNEADAIKFLKKG